MLKEILAAEKNAKIRTQEAEKYKADTVSEVKKARNEIIEKRMKEAHDAVAEIKANHSSSVDGSLTSVEESCREAKEKLLAAEKANSQKWIDGIYAKVLSDD